MILGGGVAVCLLLLVHHAVIFAIAQLSCFRYGTKLNRVATLHRATLNRAVVKRRHFNGRQLTGATFKRSDN